MRKTITITERYQLLGLLTLGIQHKNIVDQVEKAMAKITKGEVGDHLGDALYNGDTDIDTILENMGIEVTDATT